MTKKEIMQYAYNKAFLEVKDNKDAIDIEGYAKYCAYCEDKYRGFKKCFKHKKQFNGINLTSQLSLIQDETIEKVLLIALLDGEIQETFIFSGCEDNINADQYFRENEFGVRAIDFILKWNEKGADICNYHNHPMTIAAIPSKEDFRLSDTYYPHWSNPWTMAANNYNIDLPNGFLYSDWGVITPFDFFSYQQSIKNGITKEELEENEKAGIIKRCQWQKRYFIKGSYTYCRIENKICDLKEGD